MATSLPKVVTIVLNWNGKHLLERCLPDLVAQDYPEHRVLVVDNGSEDGSQFWLRGAHPDIELIENHANIGFAEGHNVGVRRVLEDPDAGYIAVVNNDTRIPSDWVSRIVEVLEERPDVGAAQSPLVFEHDPEEINSLGIAIEPSLWAFDDGCLERDPTRFGTTEIFGPTAGAAVYRRAMVEDVLEDGSLFDPRFFAYYEDVDLAFRARLRGWRSLLVAAPPVRHIGSATAGRHVGRKVFLLERNHWFYVSKNVPSDILRRRLTAFLRKRVSRTLQWTGPGGWRVLPWSVRGNIVWLAWLPYLVRTRRRALHGTDEDALEAAMRLRAGASERARV